MTGSNLKSCTAAVVLAAAFLIGALPARAGVGELDKLLKKGKKPAEKKDVAKKADEAKPEAGGSRMVFSKSPINVARPANLTTSFKAGDHIYALITLKDAFKAVCNEGGEGKKIVQVKCAVDGKHDHKGGFNVTLKGKALDSKHLVMDIAPVPAKMTAYKDANVVYQKKLEKLGKKGGAMQLTKLLSGLSAGKHTIKLTLYRYKNLAAGRFTIEGADYKKYAELFKKLEAVDTEAVTMPKPKMLNRKLMEEMIAVLKASDVKEARDGRILRVVIIDRGWHLERHKISGRVLLRYIRTDVAVEAKSGTCWLWRFIFKQDFMGGKFQKTKLHGIGKRKKILAKNIK